MFPIGFYVIFIIRKFKTQSSFLHDLFEHNFWKKEQKSQSKINSGHYILMFWILEYKFYEVSFLLSFLSKVFVLLLFLILVFDRFFKENSTNDFKLSLFGRLLHSADLKLSLKWTIFPVGERVLVISRHFDSFLGILVNEFKDVFTIKRFSCRFF